jgi:multidrug efflux pump subunit AcrB
MQESDFRRSRHRVASWHGLCVDSTQIRKLSAEPKGDFMWIVRLALNRTYTFVVVAVLIAVLGAVSIYRLSTDVFPSIDIPVVSVVWSYTGMPADEVESRIVFLNERILTASVNGIEHIESQSLNGVAVIRIYFQPGANIAEAEAQVTATCQTLLKLMPPGITPPYIVRYSATSVPIL